MLADSALDRIIGLWDDNGNTKRRRSKLGMTALVAHQENNPCCLEFQVKCYLDSPVQSEIDSTYNSSLIVAVQHEASNMLSSDPPREPTGRVENSS